MESKWADTEALERADNELRAKVLELIARGEIDKMIALVEASGRAKGIAQWVGLLHAPAVQGFKAEAGVKKARNAASEKAAETRNEIIQAVAAKLKENCRNSVSYAAEHVAQDNSGRAGWSKGSIIRAVKRMTKEKIFQEALRTLADCE